MANLLLTILDKAGVPQDSVGDSTGPLIGALSDCRHERTTDRLCLDNVWDCC